MSESTIHGRIRAAALAHGEKTAFHFFRDGWQTLSYGEFIHIADALAGRLKAFGIGKGDRVAIIAENRPEWPAAYMGVLMAGAQAVPVDMRLTAFEIRNIIEDSEAKCAVHTRETEDDVREAAGGLQVDLLDLDAIDRSERFPQVDMDDTDEEDVASLLYTSGTTGSPKAVMLTHKNICSDADAVLSAGIIGGEYNILSVLPLHHTYPFMCTFVVPMLLGAAMTFPKGLKGPELLSAIRETGVTVLIGVPQMLELMYKRMMERIRESRLSWALLRLIALSGRLRGRWDVNLMGRLFAPLGRQFRFMASGGARLDPAVMRGLEALGFTVLEGYGLTETSPIVAFNPLERRKPGSVGRALSPAEITILSPSEAGEGEIAVRGPMVMMGYYRRPGETAEVMRDGWFRSGDLGYMDEDGYLFITGRLKELIVLGSGKNVYPEEVEKHYLQCPLVKEICVVEDGGRLRAVIVPDTGHARAEKVGNIDEALRWDISELSEALPAHMRIKGYVLRSESLPRTPLGKLRRYLIEREVERKAPEGGIEDDAALLAEEAGRAIVGCLKPLLGEDMAVRASDNLELDLGLDSLMRVELAVSLERVISVKIPETLMSEVQTVGDLLETVRELGEAGGEAEKREARGVEAVLAEEPSIEDKKKVGLERGVIERTFPAVALGLLRLLMKLFFRLEARGLGNIPAPPCIIAANHGSYLDGFAVAAGVSPGVFRGLYFLGIQKYFAGRLTSLFGRLAHVIPIDPDAYLHNALKLSSYVLRNGNSLLIFPEGGRTFDGNVMRFKKGVGILAQKLGVPVVPARIEGTYEIWPRGAAGRRPTSSS
jgi:long-chain acyl-CoA synthetase